MFSLVCTTIILYFIQLHTSSNTLGQQVCNPGAFSKHGFNILQTCKKLSLFHPEWMFIRSPFPTCAHIPRIKGSADLYTVARKTSFRSDVPAFYDSLVQHQVQSTLCHHLRWVTYYIYLFRTKHQVLEIFRQRMKILFPLPILLGSFHDPTYIFYIYFSLITGCSTKFSIMHD